jgi:hypothetical protein
VVQSVLPGPFAQGYYPAHGHYPPFPQGGATLVLLSGEPRVVFLQLFKGGFLELLIGQDSDHLAIGQGERKIIPGLVDLDPAKLFLDVL